MYKTKNDLPQTTRTKIISLLNERLADSVDLQTQVKQAHWNVKGANFIGLHKLFDEIAEEAEDYSDLLAERIVQLGGIAEGTARVAASRSTLKEYPLDIGDGTLHVEALSAALAAFGAGIRKAIAKTDEMGDADASDICTEISRGTDKWLWFVEAHVQTLK